AVGAAAVIPDIVGVDLPNVSTFNGLTDAIDLRQAANKNQLERVAVIGGGYIGCELCESFRALWGIETILYEQEPQVLPLFLDADLAQLVAGELKRQKVDLRLGTAVREIAQDGEKLSVITTAGRESGFDRVILACGVRPRTGLARSASLGIGVTAGIKVDHCMCTSNPHVYAVGDCVESVHAVTGSPCYLPLGSIANRMGRVAANAIAGIEDGFAPVCGSACLKIFDLNVAATGLTAKAALERGFMVGEARGYFLDKPHYYPEVENVSVKLVYDTATLRLLGVQAVGKGEVHRRVDVASIMLRTGWTLDQMRDHEHAYSPPYAEALEPLQVLSFIGIAQEREEVRSVAPLKLAESAAASVVLDVREDVEVQSEPFPLPCQKWLHVPFTQLRDRLNELPRDERLLVICERGTRSAETTRFLQANGFEKVQYLSGGLRFLQT
ncbi:MAG: FAD-dependent oxidoreductase, partial [bacterium]